MTEHTIVKAAGTKVFVKQIPLPYKSGRWYTHEGFRVSHNPAEWPKKLQRRELL